MEESVTYQAILRKGEERGRIKEARRILLVQGSEKFGAPDEATRLTLDSIDDRERLEELSKRLLGASTWHDLLKSER